MDDDEKLKIVLKATSSMSDGVVIVMAGVAYEGYVTQFYAGKFKATVRVCGDPSQTARFQREFSLAEIEDIALTEVEDVRMATANLPGGHFGSAGVSVSGVVPPFSPPLWAVAQGARGNSSAGAPSINNPNPSQFDAMQLDILSNELQRAAAATTNMGIASDIVSRQIRAALGNLRHRKPKEDDDGSKPDQRSGTDGGDGPIIDGVPGGRGVGEPPLYPCGRCHRGQWCICRGHTRHD